jgi:hypothetical protein
MYNFAVHLQHSIPYLAHNVGCVDQAVKVEQSFEIVTTFQRDNSKPKSINAKIMEFIALDNQPFSVVGDVGFRDWLSTDTL